MNILKNLLLTFLAFSLTFCSPNDHQETPSLETLYQGFVDPPAEARPFVRWWWNGNKIDSAELSRELDLMQAAGLGGIEINPIAMPEEADDLGRESVRYLSTEWNRLLVHAAQGARERGMIADMIVGSGWPFGGEFLTTGETIQRVITYTREVSGGETVTESAADIIQKAIEQQRRQYSEQPLSNEVFFIRLFIEGLEQPAGTIDLMDNFSNDKFEYQVPADGRQIVFGVLQKGHREVMHGAPGAAGPVMDHYKADITREYLQRLQKIADDTGVELAEIIRALFCDSIELAGANWTDGFAEIFHQTYGYQLEPYYPFVFYDPYRGYLPLESSSLPEDKIRRVRYDYNKLLVDVFLDNFTSTFQAYCSANGLQARYQAYGTPFLMGMVAGNMITDIPESNNWIYSADMNSPAWTWNQGHGYMIWNMYAASGGHLTGRKIISCESMTNTRGVFKTALEEIKVHDDMNFITGMNHAVLHGFNYSPPGAGFPGWIRYGSYFSEQNPWWPYFSKWVDYNARLSYIFQEAKPVKNIAILAPISDLWADKGLTREPFHLQPWYCHRLWEPLSQAGSSCEYINEEIIRDAEFQDGKLNYGPMSYQALVLCDVKSMEEATARALQKYVAAGGKLVFVNEVPKKSFALQDADASDQTVARTINELIDQFPGQVISLKSPGDEASLLPWATDLLEQLQIGQDLQFAEPNPAVYQIHSVYGQQDVYFFTNTHRFESVGLQLTFPVENQVPWVWNPEDGSRYPLTEGSANQINLHLQPMESKLIVFQPAGGEPGIKDPSINEPGNLLATVGNGWKVEFEHVNGSRFSRDFDQLQDLGSMQDPELNTFAGVISYTTTFESDQDAVWIDLGNVNRGVTEVYLNGKPVGTRWYGKHRYHLKDNLQAGANELQVKYTTVLSNYCRSLTDNPTAARWTRGFEVIPVGLEGPVRLFGEVGGAALP